MLNGEKKIARPLRWGMVGGGRTGQVGYKHRTGALRDNTAYKLVCGAFDLDFERGKDFGRNLGVAEDRLYPDYQTLIAEEAKRDDGVEVVTIATPNFTHYEITKACLEAGLHVICEKPLFFTVAECEEIAALAAAKGLIVGVTYGFTGHPLVHQMAAMVKKGMLGDIRIVDLQYTHGFNSGDDANASEAQRWRTNPKTSGPTFVLGDIGTHHLLPVGNRAAAHEDREAALRPAVVHQVARTARGQRLCPVALRQRRGRPALGLLRQRRHMASQRYRFVGSKASVEWSDTHPERARSTRSRASRRGSCTTACPISRRKASRYERMGALHTEGLGDSWANIYLWIAQAIDARNRGDEAFLKDHHYPGIEAGTEGVRWLENCVRSAEAGSVWVDFK